MALPTIDGRGFIISDEIDFKALASGQLVANFTVAFNKSRKNEQTDEWERTHEIVVRATAWGDLAQFIADNFSSKVDIDLSGEVYTEKFERRDGSEGSATAMVVRKVGGPVPKRDSNNGGGSGGGNNGAKRQQAAKSKGSNPWGSNPANNPSNGW
ncbi:single-stranded DNA-binding protein [Antrihabitans cavernicola]|uniref:Single-stranded DNA-binding protein n=1 Tax=Antrihabitans cavernicola TaxID=2495913 RepID=A0A5A7SB72_9NOCA|nr:single-stranded DNA-binding protein [Spelaeibacter cavernicola]KAA0021823.1 single-stranded DNA-binding protein [Spelaeibacter cavernicola]